MCGSTQKKSKASFAPFFEIDVELFMRTYIGDEIQRRAREIAKQTGITLKKIAHDPPAVADSSLQAKIEAAATGLGLRTTRLPSGAGHDAQMIAKVAPIGMIFVPSVVGISHSPREFTRWEDCANGANVLLHSSIVRPGERMVSTVQRVSQ